MIWLFLLRMHLHHEILRLPPQLIAQFRFLVQSDGGEAVKEKRQDCQTVSPTQIIPIGVHQPVATDVRGAEYCHRKEHENRCGKNNSKINQMITRTMKNVLVVMVQTKSIADRMYSYWRTNLRGQRQSCMAMITCAPKLNRKDMVTKACTAISHGGSRNSRIT